MHARLSTFQAARDASVGLERILEREVLSEFEHIDGYSGMVGLLDRASGGKRVLTEDWDRSPSGIAWSADSRTIWSCADNLGQKSLFA